MRLALGMLAIAAVAALAVFASSANVRYLEAERLYWKGDFEKASLQCQKALQRNPRHAPARALFTEVEFILGRGRATPTNGEYDRFMHQSYIPTSRLLSDVDQTLDRADRHRIAGECEAGMKEVRKVREFLKWMPAGDEQDARKNRAHFLEILLATDGSTDD